MKVNEGKLLVGLLASGEVPDQQAGFAHLASSLDDDGLSVTGRNLGDIVVGVPANIERIVNLDCATRRQQHAGILRCPGACR